MCIRDSTSTVSLSSGSQQIVVRALNDGGPASFAAALYDSNNTLVWHTRSPIVNPVDPKAIYGIGGKGADAPDRVSPYNWAGNPGTDGVVILSY